MSQVRSEGGRDDRMISTRYPIAKGHNQDTVLMDDRVLRAMVKWPKVPGVYGWLALDRRGRWRLDGGLVRNRNTAQAINRNYGCDPSGRSYYQNGPQRSYVELEYTPWVYVLDGDGRLHTHTGLALKALQGAWLDDESNLLLESEHGIGVGSDVDLDTLTEQFCDSDGQTMEDEEIEKYLELSFNQCFGGLYFKWDDRLIPIERIRRDDVAEQFGYVTRPVADDNPVPNGIKEN